MPKLAGRATALTFLGIEIDTQSLQLRLPRAKLAELKALVAAWKQREVCTKRELESLTGNYSMRAGW